MKRIIHFIILAFVMLTSCDELNVTPKSGKYVHADKRVTTEIVIVDGEAVSYASISDGTRISVDNIKTSGRYPNYIYKVDGMKMEANFVNEGRFMATCNGKIEDKDDEGYVIHSITAAGYKADFVFVE